MGSWGAASFENDAAGDWFLLLEEAPDPGAVMASAIDDVLSAAEYVDADSCCEAVAAAELCACCAGQLPDRLPDNVQVGFRRIRTGRTPTRSSWRFRPSIACGRRASCVTSGKTPETVLSGWLKSMISYRDWGGRAPEAHPPCPPEQALRIASGGPWLTYNRDYHAETPESEQIPILNMFVRDDNARLTLVRAGPKKGRVDAVHR